MPARRLTLPLALLSFPALAVAADTTALNALKLLPAGQEKLLARIEARGGTPAPERWHILVHEKSAQNGLREYVVAGGELVASRELSQFAEALTEADVIGAAAIRLDSDDVAKRFEQYAQVNHQTVAAVHYDLRKDGAEAVPLWYVSGEDRSGKALGSLVVAAGKGTVISHDGFALVPEAPKVNPLPPPVLSATRPAPTPAVAVPTAKPVVKTPVKPPLKVAGEPATPTPATAKIPEPAAVPFDAPEQPAERPGMVKRVGGSLQRAGGSVRKFFTGRDSDGR